MSTICLFSSYGDTSELLNYQKFYLEALAQSFDKILIITNSRNIGIESRNFLANLGIEKLLVENEGADFGMWYKALNYLGSIDAYDEIGFINDSCIPLDKVILREHIDRLRQSPFEYGGFTDSIELRYHIQSYFTLVRKKCFKPLLSYYNKCKILNNRDNVILQYEVGLCTYLRSKGLTLGALYPCGEYNRNQTLSRAKELLAMKMPLFKKKLVTWDFSLLDLQSLESRGLRTLEDYRPYLIEHFSSSDINYLLEGVKQKR